MQFFIIFILFVFPLESISPKVIAHRGASGQAPENTLSAFKLAEKQQVDAIEMDIHLSKEGIPIIIHDGNFGATTDSAFLQRTLDLSLAQIKELDVGGSFHSNFQGEKIPTLKEVFTEIRTVPLMLEIKQSSVKPEVIAEAVVSLLQETPTFVWIGSFDPEILEAVKQLAPGRPLIGILERVEMIETFKQKGISHLAIAWELLSPSLIEELHREKIEVWTYTVDNPLFAKYLASIEVDGIITNHPSAIQKALQ